MVDLLAEGSIEYTARKLPQSRFSSILSEMDSEHILHTCSGCVEVSCYIENYNTIPCIFKSNEFILIILDLKYFNKRAAIPTPSRYNEDIRLFRMEVQENMVFKANILLEQCFGCHCQPYPNGNNSHLITP